MFENSEALLQHRILFLTHVIGPKSANELISHLLLLDAESHTDRIDLYINCPGGSVTDGLAIIDAIRCIQAPVSTLCIGQSASMAAWILACGVKGKRYASPNAEIMIHQIAGGISGEMSDIQIHAERMLRMQENLIELFCGWTGRPEHKVRKDMMQDFFMTAEEARKYGIIDHILKPYDQKEG